MARVNATNARLMTAPGGPSGSPATAGGVTGRLIILEGPDGVGKSTIAAALTAALRADGLCELQSFPGRDPGTLGHLIYSVHHESARFGIASVSAGALQAMHVAAHLDAIERRIRPALRAGHDVVLDRFWWSTLVYGAVAGLDRSLLTALIAVERLAWGMDQPYLAILLRRDTPISRDDEDGTRWMALRAEYDALAVTERASHPVLVVENAPSVVAARDRILAVLRPPRSTDTDDSSGRSEGRPPDTHLDAAPNAAQGDVRSTLRPRSRPRPRGGRDGRNRMAQGGQIAIEMTESPPSLSAESAGDSEARTASALMPHTPNLPHLFVRHLAPAKATAVYETYWRFAVERQNVFFRRVNGALAPWTDDPILSTYKFTNAYRAADRVSQYLIKNVIYRSDLPSAIEEVCFRIILFKLFNKIQTWQLLERELGPVTWADFRVDAYDRILAAAMARGRRIYSAAYIMPPGGRAFGHSAKHRNHLALLERMMAERLPARLADARSMQAAFELLRSYPTIGDFLAYQFVTDINYSNVTHFSEMDFVVPGPGALSGIRKCFADTGGLNEPEIIRLITDLQGEEVARLGLEFRSLWGRPLQLIDCQNLFCEVDKYARVRHPDVEGRAGRTQIKQRYTPVGEEIAYWFPPKWQLNARIEQERTERNPTSRRDPVQDTLELLLTARPSGERL